MFNVPILLIIYNRIEETHNIFQTIRAIQPSKLYVAADGHCPEDANDYITCLRTRSVMMPEWNCQLKKLFKDEHLGKSKMVYQAISWFFEHEEEGIILFDDTLPHLDFYSYCAELLEKYRDNTKIVHIGANNFQKKHKRGNASYYFSAYSTIWGFATWRRTWKNFDLKMSDIDETGFPSVMSEYIATPKARNYWQRRFDILKNMPLDMWEYQYNFHLWNLGGLSITPNINLVSNKGFRNKVKKIKKLSMATHPILPLVHPAEISQHCEADDYAFKKYYNKAFLIMFADWFNENLLGKEKKL